MRTLSTVRTALLCVILVALAACGGGEIAADGLRGPASSVAPDRADETKNRLASPVPDASELFRWAEYKFPTLFPKGPISQALTYEGVDYTVRGYVTGNFLGITAAGSIFGLGPFTANVLTPFGNASGYAELVAADACRVNPGSCPTSSRLATLAVGSDFGIGVTLAVRDDGGLLQISASTSWLRASGVFVPGSYARLLTGIQAKAVDVGPLHNLALGADGQVYGWGVNEKGLIGDVTGSFVDSPRLMPGVSDVRQVVASEHASLALTNSGQIWHWPGISSFDASSRVVPRMVEGLRDASSIVKMGNRVLVVRSDGSVWELVWEFGPEAAPFGIGLARKGKVNKIDGLSDVNRMSCGINDCVALLNNGFLIEFWRSGPILGPVTLIPHFKDVIDFSLGEDGLYVVGATGDVWILKPDHTQPEQIVFPAPAMAVAASGHIVVRLRDGTLWGWGRNIDGQLGDGTKTYRPQPVPMLGLNMN